MAAGAGTIYRNYFVPVRGRIGQTEHNQLDGLLELGQQLAKVLFFLSFFFFISTQNMNVSLDDLWKMRNGYCLCSGKGLAKIAAHLDTATEEEKVFCLCFFFLL